MWISKFVSGLVVGLLVGLPVVGYLIPWWVNLPFGWYTIAALAIGVPLWIATTLKAGSSC